MQLTQFCLKHKKSQSGMVLLIMLTFLLVITLLVMSTFQLALLQTKLTARAVIARSLVLQAQDSLLQLQTKKRLENNACLLSSPIDENTARHSINWWSQRNDCIIQLGQTRVFYAFLPNRQSVCVQLPDKKRLNFVDFYHLYVAAMAKSHQQIATLAASIAVPSQTPGNCDKPIVLAHTGLQTWYMIN